MHHLGLLSGSQLDAIHQIIQLLCDDVGALPRPAQLWTDAFLPLGVVEPNCITLVELISRSLYVVMGLHLVVLHFEVLSCIIMHFLQTVEQSLSIIRFVHWLFIFWSSNVEINW